MKSFRIWSILFLPLLLVNHAECVRNLFLPKTGDISINAVIAENLSNVTNFETLLGAGRSLSYPFSAGMLISIATLANENNWKVSDSGFSNVLAVPRDEIVESYGTLFEMLERDENVTVSNILYSFRPSFSPSEALVDTLMTEVREVTWTRDTWKETYRTMVEHLGNVTNERIDTLLIPSVTERGTPFRSSTEAVIVNTFHYINTWQYPWMGAEIGSFEGNQGIPYLSVEGKFWVAYDQDFTAVSVPLEGGSKSVVFVLPHVNITAKYFRNQAEADDENDPIDVVPFPKKWELKTLRLKIPTFNTTDVDQYGQELEQAGMNETFCTIIHDYVGRYPYYMRPMVQINFLDFNEDYLEIASATGVAVEKFRSIFTIVGQGTGGDNNDDRKQDNSTQPPETTLSPSSSSQVTSSNDNNIGVQGRDDASNPSINGSYVNLDETPAAEGEIPTLVFDRPFLWYLNDSEVGPMFFGTVEILTNLALEENTTEPGGEDEGATTTVPPTNPMNSTSQDQDSILSEHEKNYLWSCRSFFPNKDENENQEPSSSSFEADVIIGQPAPNTNEIEIDNNITPVSGVYFEIENASEATTSSSIPS